MSDRNLPMTETMSSRLSGFVLRIVVLALVWVLATTSLTFAQQPPTPPPPPAPAAEPAPAEDEQPPPPLVVPDLRGHSYVFAKSMLVDAGFAWRVAGPVHGFAANRVFWQSVNPGARVVDTGAPTLVLRLDRNRDYDERGLPQDTAPFEGTELVLAPGQSAEQAIPDSPGQNGDERATSEKAKKEDPSPPPPPPAPDDEGDGDSAAKPAAAKATAAKPARSPAKAKPAAKQAKPAAKQAKPAAKPKAAKPRYRKPDFVVPGANREPASEMPLPARARMVAKKLAGVSSMSQELMDWWQYQHAWVVVGARFGWQQGGEALRILIEVDRDLQRRFGMGYGSEQQARAALAFVRSHKEA